METLRRTPRTTIAIATAALIVVSTALGYWILPSSGDKEVVGWIIVSIAASLIAAALLLRFVPATESESDGNAPARRSLVLGVVALVTVAVFWTALPIAVGIPALLLGAEGRARNATYGQAGEATAGALLGGVAAVAAVVLLISGA